MKIGFDLQTVMLGAIILITIINAIGTWAVCAYIKSFTDPVFGWISGDSSKYVATVNCNITFTVFLVVLGTIAWIFSVPNKKFNYWWLPMASRIVLFVLVLIEVICKSVLAYKSNAKYLEKILLYIIKDGDLNPEIEFTEDKFIQALKWLADALVKEESMYMLDRKVMPFLTFSWMNAMLITLYWLSALVFKVFPDFGFGSEPMIPEPPVSTT